MSDINVNKQRTPQELEIEYLETSRRKWRKAGFVFGWLALVNAPLTGMFLSNSALLFDYSLGFSVAWVLVAYAVFSTIPFLLFAFVCMGLAFSRKNSAAKLRHSSAN